MANIFISKSARTVNKKAGKVISTIEKPKFRFDNNFIAWIGSDSYDLAKASCAYGFDEFWYKTKADLEKILFAKAVILCNVLMTPDVLAAINFAAEYGVPLVWIHSYRHPPARQIWSFTFCINYQPKITLFWRALCRKIG